MNKTSTKSQTETFSVLQILGSLLLVFAAVDFVLSWMGINLINLWVQYLDFHQLSLVLLEQY